MKNNRIKLVALMLICLVVIVTGCSKTTGPSDNTTTGAKDEVVVAYSPDIFNTLNPFETNAYSDAFVFNQVYETLAVADENGEPASCLAKTWEVSEDGKIYTIKLVEDAKFHNGETLKASDVAFTYSYAKDFPSRTNFYNMVEKVEVIDDSTIKFELTTPTPLFLIYSQEIPIINEKFVNENDGDFSKVACGTGPYILKNFDPAVKVELTRFEDYRLGAASIKDAEIRYMSDRSSAAVALETGEINYMSVPISNAETYLDESKFNSRSITPAYTALIAMNTTVKPFDNILVRQAFSYAADKQSIIEIAYEGYGTEAKIQAYTNCFGVDLSDVTDFSYNPEKAKQLLAEAGYPDGMVMSDFGVEMKTFAGYHSKIAQVFQQNLADIGVIIEIANTETPDEDVESGNYSIMNQGASYRADFSYTECNYGSVGIGGNNYSRMNEPWVDEMFKKGVIEQDPEKRKAIYKELIEYLVDYAPSIPIFHKQEIYAWTKNLNANAHDNANHPFYFYEWSWN